jgi:minor extracellular serine protease Vpr
LSKFLPQFAVASIAIAAIVIINTGGVQASGGAEILPISVLAQSKSNYGVDSGLVSVPAVSMDIIEDKIQDEMGSSSPNRLVTYPPANLVTQPGSPAEPNLQDLAGTPADPVLPDSLVGTPGISILPANPTSTPTACSPGSAGCSGNSGGNGNGQGNGHGNGNGNGKGNRNGNSNGNGNGNGNSNGNGNRNGKKK